MVNQQVLKEQITKTPPNMPNGGDIFMHIFTVEPNLRKYWDMEDIDPEQVSKSRLMQQKGAGFLSSLNQLITHLENERQFKLECTELRDNFKEVGLTSADVKKLAAGVAAFFEAKVGKLSDAQKKGWIEFFDLLSANLKEAGLE